MVLTYDDEYASHRYGLELRGRQYVTLFARWFDDRWWSVLRYELTASEWSDVTTTIRVRRPVPV